MKTSKTIKQGHIVSTTRFLQVDSVESLPKGQQKVSVTDLVDGMQFEIHGVDLVDDLDSANEFEKTKKLSRTDLAKKLTESYNIVFSVCFDKADGTERVLRGRLMKPEPLLGRSHCEDLEVTKGCKLRLVDHRTLKWMIVEGVKYTVK